MLPIFCNDVAMGIDRKISRNAQVELVVGSRIQLGVETVHKIKDPSLIEYGCWAPNVSTAPEQRQIMLTFNAKLSRRRKDHTGCVDDAAVARNKGALRMFADTANSCFQCVRKEPVVGIEKNEELTAAVPQPRVAGARKTGIFLINIAHRGMAPNNFGGI